MKAAADVVQRLTLTEIGARQFEIVEPGATYKLTVPGAMVTFEIERLTWHRHELTGELMVRCDLEGTDAINGVLSVASFNLSSARARTERATQLERQSRARDIPWHPLVEELCQRVLAAERSGDPAVALRDVETCSDLQPLIQIFGFEIPRRHPSIIFGDGGATKSLLALYIGGLLARDGYRVLLCDWELDAIDHRERYETLFGTEMPATLFYTRCTRPLVHDVDRIKRIVRTQAIDFKIHDSVGFACHEAPETAAAALAYFQADRQIGIGGLHIAHINRSEQGDQRPFGSAFWHNSARATWFLKPVDDAGIKTIGVWNRKHNIRKYEQVPFSYTVIVDGNRTTFRLSEITAVPALADKVSLSQRIHALLKAGARTRDEIAAEWPGERPDTLRRTLNREIEKGRLVRFPGPGGVEQIGLKARAS